MIFFLKNRVPVSFFNVCYLDVCNYFFGKSVDAKYLKLQHGTHENHVKSGIFVFMHEKFVSQFRGIVHIFTKKTVFFRNREKDSFFY
jgi:hypothetical protein